MMKQALAALEPRQNFGAFLQVLRTIRRHKALCVEMARREMGAQYAGQVLSALWVIIHPLFLTALYIFIFSYVLKIRLGETVDMPLDYTTYILTGLIPWIAFQQVMGRSVISLLTQSNLVKQVVFPIEVIPLTSVIVSCVPQVVGLIVLLIYVFLSHGLPPATYLLLPFVLVFQLMAMMGLAFMLSALGPFFRDLKDFVALFGVAGVYLVPAFYLPNWTPEFFKPLLYLNPFSYPIWVFQDVLFFGKILHPLAWAAFLVGSTLLFVFGYRLFRSLKPHVANVL